jgi:hypothetical protein
MCFDFFNTHFSTSFLPRSWKRKDTHSLAFMGDRVRLAYSSNEKEKQVYMRGMVWMALDERTPAAEKG